MDSETEPLAVLTAAYLEDRLDAAGRLRLTEILATDPQALATFNSQVRIATNLAGLRPTSADLVPRLDDLIDHLRSSRQQRTVQAVMRRRQQRSRWPMILAMAAAIAVAIGLVLVSQTTNDRSVIGTIGNAVACRSADGSPVVSGALLHAEDRLVGTADLHLKGGIRLHLAGEVTLASANGHRIRLTAGEIACEVPADRGLTFGVDTTTAAVSVVGTRFQVALGDGMTRIAVEKGRVQVEDVQGHRVILPEGGRRICSAHGSHDPTGPLRRLFDIKNLEPGLPGWYCPTSPQRNRNVSLSTGGALHPKVLKIVYDTVVGQAINQAPWDWAAYALDPAEDWRQVVALRFALRGQGRSRRFHAEIRDNGGERFLHEIVDSTTEWRMVELPLSGFVRRSQNGQPSGAPNDGLTLTKVGMVGFLFTEGAGEILVDNFNLVFQKSAGP
ncbi:hypothetical protein LBMAG53_34640 [Planctomycetota bacterium]|nr:hypothetical protein LBMAG53_34640 [Planctomycetota bacterium]